MALFNIIVGSVLGASEYVADALSETLNQAGHKAVIHLQPEMSALDQGAIWLVCTSTHGAGDLPDNIQPFAEQLKQADLTEQPFIVVGLGDSSYDTYCHGAMTMEQTLLQQGATLLAPALHIDVLNHPIPEDKAVEWLQNWLPELNNKIRVRR